MESIDLLFHNALRFAGPIMFMGMQVTSWLTAQTIYRTRSVGQLSIFPFVSMWTNCFLWSLYGLLRNDYTVLVPNFAGAITGLGCAWIYHNAANEEMYERENKFYYIVSACISLYGMVCTAYGADEAIGTLGVIMCVVLMGSPLIVLRTVLVEKNCSAMPFWTSLAIWFNTLCWMLYGLLDAHDFMVYFPNIIGLILASIQMVFFAIFGVPQETFELHAPTLPTKRTASAAVLPPFTGGLKGPVIPVRAVYSPLSADAAKQPNYATQP